MSKKALDNLGVAIADAGYTWTPEMRSAYEKGVRKEWVGLTEDEAWECWDWEDFSGTWKAIEAKLKEKNT